MNEALARIFGPEWANVRSTVIKEERMHMAHDICKILGISNVTVALRGTAGICNVDPQHRTMELIEDWNKFRTVHLLTIKGVFQLILNNKSTGCRRIKERISTDWLPRMLEIRNGKHSESTSEMMLLLS